MNNKKDDWFQTGIGIIKKYNKHIKLESSVNGFIISSKKDLNISNIDINRLKELGWEQSNNKQFIRII